MMMQRILQLEEKLWKKGFKKVIGLDEVGRGPLAGPVVSAAVSVISNSKLLIPKLKDSKKLTPKKREEFYKILTKNLVIEWGIGRVSEKIIDRINILEATKLAMIKAVKNLEKKFQKQYISNGRQKRARIDYLILDGNFKINLAISQKSIIKADEKVFSCMAASIIAKVTRDRIMKKYNEKYPQYGFNQHKGYGTKLHFKMLKKYGRCVIHRNSFKY